MATTDDHKIAGDSWLLPALLPECDAATVFARLKAEIVWQEMFHRGGAVPRLVCMQGTLTSRGAGWVEPIYRHPADDQPPMVAWSPTVELVRRAVNMHRHGAPVNHALIQLYRGGDDYISEHADKTLDVRRGSSIVSVSFGATRQFILRPKKGLAEATKGRARDKLRIDLPHNSMFSLGWETNRAWLHSIRRDRRPASTKRPDELRDTGERISLTFRTIDTFCARAASGGRHCDYRFIWGQGAPHRDEASAASAVVVAEAEAGDPSGEALRAWRQAESARLLHAFHDENADPEFDWDAAYGGGFE